MTTYSGKDHPQHETDNRSNQRNPNNRAYWDSRKHDDAPDDDDDD